jgi:hypothetical protein
LSLVLEMLVDAELTALVGAIGPLEYVVPNVSCNDEGPNPPENFK